MPGDAQRCLQEGFTVALNLPGTSTSHSKPQTSTTLHHPLESSLEGEEKVGATAVLRRGTYKVADVLLSLQQQPGKLEAQFHFSFAISAAQIHIFHLARECHNHQATGYSGLRYGGYSDRHSWKLFFTVVTETTSQQRKKVCKGESYSHLQLRVGSCFPDNFSVNCWDSHKSA